MGWFSAVAERVAGVFVVDQLERDLNRASEALRAAEVATRLDAVRALAGLPRGGADDLIMSALRDADPSVRAAAAGACGTRSLEQALPALGVLLDDADAAVRAALVTAIDEIGTPAESLDRSPPLGLAPPPIPRDARVPPMLARLLRDGEASVRSAALRALPRQGVAGVHAAREHVEAVPAAERAPLLALAEQGLVAALRSDDPRHRQAAVEALHAHGCAGASAAIIELLRDTAASVRQAAVGAVAALAPAEALPELLVRLDDPDEAAASRAIESLVAIHASGVLTSADADALHERLLAIAAHRSGRPQAMAAWALGETGRIQSLGTLTGLLDSPAEDVVVKACGALERLRDARAVNALIPTAREGKSPLARSAAIRALAALGDVRAVPALVDALMRDHHNLPVGAADAALGALCGEVESREREAFTSNDAAARLAAIDRVRADIRSVRLLLAAIIDAPDAPCRAAAVSALAELGFPALVVAEEALASADQPEGRRMFAMSLAAAMRPAHLPALLGRVLSDTNEPSSVYLEAVRILASLGTTEARQRLVAAKEHARPEVREAIAKALGAGSS